MESKKEKKSNKYIIGMTLIIILILCIIGIVIYMYEKDNYKKFIYNTKNNGIEDINNEDINNTNINNMSSNNEIGDIKQETVLKDQNGIEYKLSDYKGKKVILNFWAIWCHFCVEEMPTLNKIYQEYKDKDITFITIIRPEASENSKGATYKEEIKKYIKDNNIEVPVCIDENLGLNEKYNVEKYPYMISLDVEGNIKEVLEGSTYNEIKSEIENYIKH